MDIGEESEPVEVPVPLSPGQVPAADPSAPAPVPELVPA
jgi:hypothetical protein